MSKKLLKLVATAFLSAGIAFAPLAFGGCVTTPNNEDNPNHDVVLPNPDTEKPGPSEPEKPVEPENPVGPEDPEDENQFVTTDIPYEKIDAVADLINSGKNFTLVNTVNDVASTLERDGNKFFYSNGLTGENYFAINDGENDLKISYDSSSDNWVSTELDPYDRSLLTVSNANKKFEDLFYNFTFETYNTKTGEFKGEMLQSGKYLDCSVFIEKNGSVINGFEINTTDGEKSSSIEFSSFGKTNVEVPDYVKEGEVDKSEIVLTVENGKYNFNYKLILPIFEKWLKGENGYNEDLMDRLNSLKNCETNGIAYMNLAKDKIELFVDYNELDSNQRYLGQVVISNNALYDYLANVKTLTEKQFSDYLKTSNAIVIGAQNAKNYNIDYMTTDADFAENKTQFNALTNKIIERAQTVGEQGYSINNDGKKVDYSGYKIICALKTVPTNPNSLDFQCQGLNQSFNMVYLMEKDGEYYMTDILVVSSVQLGLSNLYTNITNNDATSATNWMVSKSTITEMEAGNADLYINNEKSNKINTNDKINELVL